MKKNIIESLVKLFFALSIITFFYHSYLVLSYPFSLDLVEGLVLRSAIEIAALKNPYTYFTHHNFIFASYPPVFYLLYAVLISFLGPSLLIGRLISILSAIGCAYLIFLFVYVHTRNKLLGYLCLTLFLLSPPIFLFSGLVRVDLLSLFFSLLVLWFGLNSSSKNHLYHAAIFAVLAVLTKQISFLSSFALLLCFVFTNQRAAKTFATSFFSLLILSFILINLVTEGGFIEFVYAHFLFHSFTFVRFFYYWVYYTYLFGALFAITFLYLNQMYVQRKWSVFIIYFILSFIPLFLIGKEGSYSNYYIENIAVVCLLVGFSISELFRKKEKSMSYLTILTCLGVIAMFLAQDISRIQLAPTESQVRKLHKLEGKIASIQGPVISYDSSMLISSNKTEYLFDFCANGYLTRAGLLDQNSLIDEIRHKQIPLMIFQFELNRSYDEWEDFHKGVMSPELANAICSNYKIDERIEATTFGTSSKIYEVLVPNHGDPILACAMK